MKKTVSVNIKGINFVIEEDAYELLQDYLDRLTIALQHEDGSKEIIEDVELRIAEICTSKLNDSKTVIEMADIEDILETLGDPAEYVDEEDAAYTNTANEQQSNSSDKKAERRLFRDTHNATLGGVCSGIASYFGIDVVVIRAVFLVLLFFGGFGFPLYIILWIIVPKAESTIDRLRMKGRPITVETVREEVEDAADRIKTSSQSFANKVRTDKSYKERVHRGRRILASILGTGLVLFGLLQLILFLVFIAGGFQMVPVQTADGFISITEFGELALSSAYDVRMAWIGGLLLALSSITFLFMSGSMLIFRIKNLWSKLTLGGLFVSGIVGLFILLTVGFRSAADHAFDGGTTNDVGSAAVSELVIIPKMRTTKNGTTIKRRGYNFPTLFTMKDDRIIQEGIDIHYERSNDSLFHVIQDFSARGSSSELADEKSERIKHSAQIINDTLYLEVDYSFPSKDKLRDQDVTIVIQVPEEGIVKMGGQVIHIGTEEEIEDDDIDSDVYEKWGYIRSNGKYKHHRHWWDD